jgi:hypothetical protein
MANHDARGRILLAAAANEKRSNVARVDCLRTTVSTSSWVMAWRSSSATALGDRPGMLAAHGCLFCRPGRGGGGGGAVHVMRSEQPRPPPLSSTRSDKQTHASVHMPRHDSSILVTAQHTHRVAGSS